MRFRNNMMDFKMKEAVDIANGLLTAASPLIKHITDKDDFKYNSGYGVQVALSLILSRDCINVFSYRSINPFTKAIGYFDGEAIWINTRKLKHLSIADIVGFLLHEYSHYCGFKHGNNYKTEDKCLYSVPYYLSENVKKWM